MSSWCEWGTIICRLRLFSREVNEKTDKVSTMNNNQSMSTLASIASKRSSLRRPPNGFYEYSKQPWISEKGPLKTCLQGDVLFTLLPEYIFSVRQPPIITRFLSEDLVHRNEVKFEKRGGFKLPCAASGSNLTWTWKHNGTIIAKTRGIPYLLSEDGTLKGNYLSTEHSGTYQCLVRDQTTGIEVFSRRVQVAVTGKIANL